MKGKRDLLRVVDLTKDEILALWDSALRLKSLKRLPSSLQGKVMALIFEKPSTRTRVSFESAMLKLGGSTIFLSTKDLQLARGEPIKDTARVLSRYVDVAVLRTYKQETIEEFVSYAIIPVINGLSDKHHPCQALSDFLTLYELCRLSHEEKVVWIGDGNNVAHSWLEVCAILGLPITVCCPEGFDPDENLLAELKTKYQTRIELVRDPKSAIEGATIVSTDVWASMGQEEDTERRKEVFKPYQLNSELLSLAKSNVLVLHCLPAHRDEEITQEILEGKNSIVWLQAENKMWLHMALLEFLLL